MYFTKQLDTSADLSRMCVMSFAAGFLWGPGPVYVPTDAELASALAEYNRLISRAPELTNGELAQALTNMELARKHLLTELDAKAAAFEQSLNKEMYFMSSLGFKVNGDRRTKSNLQDLITFFDLQAKEGVIEYRDFDNVNRELTKEQVQTLLVEHVANGQALYMQKWAKQAEINAAETFDALNKVELAFTMSDFSKAADAQPEANINSD